jgi:serine/threonine-protein kinase
MEYLDGKTLTDVIREQGPLSPQRVVHITGQICKSLGEAHRAGIIHRDVKPDNILLISVDGDPDYAKVLDFGIAKAVAGEEDVSLTADGRIIGTPRYMSPEQIMAQPVDHRADIYSLGCIIFEMLCGGPPFEQNSTAALMMSHAQQSPPSFAERLTRDQLNMIPEGLETVVRRAMAKNPAQRPQTTDDLRRELEQALRIHSAYSTGSQPAPHFTGPHAAHQAPHYTGQHTGQHTGSSGPYAQPAPHYTGQHTGQHTGSQAAPLQNQTGNFEHNTGNHPRQTGSFAKPTDSGSHTGTQPAPTNLGKVVISVVVVLLLGVFAAIAYQITRDETPQQPVQDPVALKALVPTDAADKSKVDEPREPAVEIVEIGLNSEPSGATVIEGSVLIGKTPTKVPFTKTGGVKSYTFRLAGYQDAQVEIDPQRPMATYNVLLSEVDKPSDKPSDKPTNTRPSTNKSTRQNSSTKVSEKPADKPSEEKPPEERTPVKPVKPAVERLDDEKPSVKVDRL